MAGKNAETPKKETPKPEEHKWLSESEKSALLGTPNIDVDKAIEGASEEELKKLAEEMDNFLKAKEKSLKSNYPNAYENYVRCAESIDRSISVGWAQDWRLQVKSYAKLIKRIDDFAKDMTLSKNFDDLEGNMDYLFENKEYAIDSTKKEELKKLDFPTYCLVLKQAYFIDEIKDSFTLMQLAQDSKIDMWKVKKASNSVLNRSNEGENNKTNFKDFKLDDETLKTAIILSIIEEAAKTGKSPISEDYFATKTISKDTGDN